MPSIWCCLVSGVMCATHISSPAMIFSRNSLPSSWYHCRNVNADSMHFTLCSGVSCFGTHLVLNFLHNRCSMTMLCKKKQEICRKCLLSSVTVKKWFSTMHSRTSSTRSSVMMDGLPLRSSCSCCRTAVNCLHQRRTICLLMTLTHRPGTANDEFRSTLWFCAFKNFNTDALHSRHELHKNLYNQLLQRCYCENSGISASACVIRRNFSITYTQSLHAVNGLIAVGRVGNLLCGLPS